MILLQCAILFSYLHVAALATTDIMRLLKDSTTSVFASKCFCSNCNHEISLIHQFPIVAYLINKGKCPYCKIKIDKLNFYLELFLYLLYVGVSFIFDFKPLSVLIAFVLYEIIKILFLFFKGHKEKNFYKEYFLSFLTNIVVFSIVMFMSVLYNFIKTGNILM